MFSVEQSLAIFKQVEENEKRQRNSKPFPRPSSKPLFYHQTRIQLYKERNFQTIKDDHIEFKQTYTCIKKHSSHKSFDELSKITLKEMFVNKVHEGRYLEAKIVYEPFYITAIQTLIQDENGDVEQFCVYNLNRSYDEDCKVLLPLGAKIKIKEPFLKVGAAGGDSYIIRVDSPSDILIVYDDEIPKSVQDPSILYEKFNKEGNEYFVKKNFHQAIKSYSKALLVKDCVKSYSNRALAYLKLECYQNALTDAEKSVRLEPNEKGYFRLGLALYSMRQYEKSLEQFQNCVKLNPGNKEALNEIEKCKKRIKESRGQYDFAYLLENSGKENLRMDVADYVSDKIEVTDIPKKGKGVIAKVDIPKNTLLVASKALSISYDCEFVSKYVLISHNLLNRSIDLNSKCQNLMSLIYKMRHDPYLSKQVYDLYPGKDLDRELKIDPSVIDTERVEAILTFNSFKSEDFNFLSDKKYDNSGLWYMPSLFNHSCLSNTTRIFLSDLVMIYTLKDVKQGEELTLSYSPLQSYQERDKISQHFGFKCRCDMCECDRKDLSGIKNREEMLKNFEKIKDKRDTKKISSMVEKLKETYKERNIFKYDLIKPISYLASGLLNEGKVVESIDCFIEAYELMKECGDLATAFAYALKISQSFYVSNKLDEAKKWLQKSDEYYSFDPLFRDYMRNTITLIK